MVEAARPDLVGQTVQATTRRAELTGEKEGVEAPLAFRAASAKFPGPST
jgi:hypothetical protein